MAAPVEPDANPINTARHANIYFAANTTAQNKLCWSCLIVGLLQRKSLPYLRHMHRAKKAHNVFTEKQKQKWETLQMQKNTTAAALYENIY